MMTCRSSEVRGAVTGLVTVVLALVAVVGTAGAQGPSVYQATLEEANQKTAEVSTDDLKRILANGSAVVLDTRPQREYAMSHIPGARNVAPKAGVSMSMYVSDVAEVQRLVGGDKTKPLILYCNGPFCGKSKRLSEELLAAGFTHIQFHGWTGYRTSNLTHGGLVSACKPALA